MTRFSSIKTIIVVISYTLCSGLHYDTSIGIYPDDIARLWHSDLHF